MSARIIDGKAIAAELRGKIAAEVKRIAPHQPGLAVVLVGANPASEVYVKSKSKAVAEVGMRPFDHKLPESVGEAELLALIGKLNADPAVNGILVQLPLPKQIDTNKVIAAIDPAKDVDGFHPINAGRLAIGLTGFIPCTPLGCLKLLKAELGDLSGKGAVVIGRSNIVGKPMAALLLAEHCTVTIAHSRTRDLPEAVRAADIVVAAVGRPGMIRGDWLKPGATVIDVGINRVASEGGNSHLVGDVDFVSASQVAGAITPVPGGVGPMTIACLIRNTLVSAARRDGFSLPEDL